MGAGLTRHLVATGVEVIEVDRPDRKARRHDGKSDPTDAVAAARAALSGRATAIPKAPRWRSRSDPHGGDRLPRRDVGPHESDQPVQSSDRDRPRRVASPAPRRPLTRRAVGVGPAGSQTTIPTRSSRRPTSRCANWPAGSGSSTTRTDDSRPTSLRSSPCTHRGETSTLVVLLIGTV